MRTPQNALVVALAISTVVLSSARVSAQQVVVTDVTYEHSAETTTDSHYRVDALPGTPADLRSPIDYASGEAYVRLEVFTKPSDAATRFQVCFEASPTYACTDQAPAYTTTGVYTWATPFSRFYQGSLVDWSRGLGRVALILKDTMNVKPAPENVGEEVSARYMPTRVRVTVTLVPPGGTYVPPDEPAPDAGPIELDAGPGTDAGTELDAGTGERPDATASDIDASSPDASTRGRDDSEIVGGCSATRASRGAPISLVLVVLACALLRSRTSRRARARRP